MKTAYAYHVHFATGFVIFITLVWVCGSICFVEYERLALVVAIRRQQVQIAGLVSISSVTCSITHLEEGWKRRDSISAVQDHITNAISNVKTFKTFVNDEENESTKHLAARSPKNKILVCFYLSTWSLPSNVEFRKFVGLLWNWKFEYNKYYYF